jgi:hypothetical protein
MYSMWWLSIKYKSWDHLVQCFAIRQIWRCLLVATIQILWANHCVQYLSALWTKGWWYSRTGLGYQFPWSWGRFQMQLWYQKYQSLLCNNFFPMVPICILRCRQQSWAILCFIKQVVGIKIRCWILVLQRSRCSKADARFWTTKRRFSNYSQR